MIRVAPPLSRTDARGDPARLREMFADHFDFIWRSLRRLGLNEAAADDAAQQVFLIASRKLDAIESGRERSFLFGTALRVTADIRRSAAYRREVPHGEVGVELEGGLRPDELLEQLRARRLLDAALEEMELDIRSVFVLFEIEGLTIVEVAEMLQIPTGTVASRLRRARKEFTAKVAKLLERGARGKSSRSAGGPTSSSGRRSRTGGVSGAEPSTGTASRAPLAKQEEEGS